jgi:hypothetical protein
MGSARLYMRLPVFGGWVRILDFSSIGRTGGASFAPKGQEGDDHPLKGVRALDVLNTVLEHCGQKARNLRSDRLEF